MAYPTEVDVKNAIATDLSANLWDTGNTLANVTTVLGTTIAANYAINRVTGRKTSLKSYFNPAEIMRSAIQLPGTLTAVNTIGNYTNQFLGLGRRIQRIKPVFVAFARPLVSNFIAPIFDKAKENGLIELPKAPTSTEQGFFDKLSSLYSHEELQAPPAIITLPPEDLSIGAQKASQIGSNALTALGTTCNLVKNSYHYASNVQVIPGDVNKVVEETGHPYLIYGGLIAGASVLLTFAAQRYFQGDASTSAATAPSSHGNQTVSQRGGNQSLTVNVGPSTSKEDIMKMVEEALKAKGITPAASQASAGSNAASAPAKP